MPYEQLTINGFFADPTPKADAPAKQTDPPPAPEDRPLAKEKRTAEKSRSREHER